MTVYFIVFFFSWSLNAVLRSYNLVVCRYLSRSGFFSCIIVSFVSNPCFSTYLLLFSSNPPLLFFSLFFSLSLNLAEILRYALIFLILSSTTFFTFMSFLSSSQFPPPSSFPLPLSLPPPGAYRTFKQNHPTTQQTISLSLTHLHRLQLHLSQPHNALPGTHQRGPNGAMGQRNSCASALHCFCWVS